MSDFEPFDWQIAPWKDKKRIVILAGAAGGGKAVCLHTYIPTPLGWRTMEDMRPEQYVLGSDGMPTKVVAVSEVMEGLPCYDVVFDDGSVVRCAGSHLWETSTVASRASERNYHNRLSSMGGEYQNQLYGTDQRDKRVLDSVVTTEHILATLRTDKMNQRINHAVSIALPIQLSQKMLAIHPYLLGVWLGDGTVGSGDITCHENESFILDKIRAIGYSVTNRKNPLSHGVKGLVSLLRGYGISHDKRIPSIYLRAADEQRMELLRGIIDTDGHITERGKVQVDLAKLDLLKDIRQLVCSLGIKPSSIRTSSVRLNGKEFVRYRLSFRTTRAVASLPRKAQRVANNIRDTQNKRFIVDVIPVSSVPVKCIQVEAEDGLFLISESFIPTHNSWLAGHKVDGFLRHYPGATGVVSRKTFEDAKSSIIPFMSETVADCANDPNVRFYKKESRIVYRHPGSKDSELWLIGMKGNVRASKSPTGVRSMGREGGVDIWWMEEGREYEEKDFTEVEGRLRGDAGGWRQIIISTNPANLNHWINLRFLLKENPGVSVYLSSADDNPTSPEDYKYSLKNMSGVEGKRLGLGLWVDGEGQVIDTWLDNFNAAANAGTGNVTSKAEYIPHGGKVVWYVDDGYSGEYDEETKMFTAKSQPRAFLIAQERLDGTIAVIGESLAVKKLQAPHIREVLDYMDRMGWPKPSYAVHDGASPSLGASLIEAGIAAHPVRAKIEDGNNLLRNWIGKDENRVRRIIVNPRCFYLRYEMGAYSYDPNGIPLDQNNHTIDALRYATWHKVYGGIGTITVSAYTGNEVNADLEREIRHRVDTEIAKALAKIGPQVETWRNKSLRT